jgi:hypothetical protein
MSKSRRDLVAPERIAHGPWWLGSPQRVSDRRLSRTHGREPGCFAVLVARCPASVPSGWLRAAVLGADARRVCAGLGRLTRWAKDRRRPPAGSPRTAVDAVGRCGPLVAAAVRRHRRVVGVVASNGRVALPPPARPAGLPVVPAGRVYHAPPLTTRVVAPSPVLVVKLTVCGT